MILSPSSACKAFPALNHVYQGMSMIFYSPSQYAPLIYGSSDRVDDMFHLLASVIGFSLLIIPGFQL